MKQTAVEWLVEQMSIKHSGAKTYFNANKLLVKQAEQMNRDQITHAYHDGRIDAINKNIKPMKQYCNETYGKETA